MVDDFNPASCTPSAAEMLRCLVSERCLRQIASSPTREGAVLDPVYVSKHFIHSTILDLPPVAGSDHSAQLVKLYVDKEYTGARLCKRVDYEQLDKLLNQFDYTTMFIGCIDTDDFASRFNETLLNAVSTCSLYKPAYRRQRLPRRIVQLLRAKQKKWLAAKRSGDFTAYKSSCVTVKAAIRSHRRNQESRLVYSNNRRNFYSYTGSKLNTRDNHVSLSINGSV